MIHAQRFKPVMNSHLIEGGGASNIFLTPQF